MTQQAEAPTAPSTTPVDAGAEPSLDERVASLKSKLSGKEAPTEETTTTATDTEQVGDTKTERAARLQKMQAEERQKRESRQAKEAREQREKSEQAEIAALKKRIAELEPLEGAYKDPERFLATAAERGLTQQQVAEWIRKKYDDPTALTSEKVSALEKTLEKRLAERDAEWQKRLEEIEAAREGERSQAAAVQRGHQFVGMVRDGGRVAPHSAAFLAKHGPEAVVQFTNRFVIPMLGDDATIEQLHDGLEQFLDDVQMSSGQPATPSAPSKPTNAAAKATLTNSLASTRATVTEEEDLSDLPLEERAERVKQRLARSR